MSSRLGERAAQMIPRGGRLSASEIAKKLRDKGIAYLFLEGSTMPLSPTVIGLELLNVDGVKKDGHGRWYRAEDEPR